MAKWLWLAGLLVVVLSVALAPAQQHLSQHAGPAVDCSKISVGATTCARGFAIVSAQVLSGAIHCRLPAEQVVRMADGVGQLIAKLAVSDEDRDAAGGLAGVAGKLSMERYDRQLERIDCNAAAVRFGELQSKIR